MRQDIRFNVSPNPHELLVIFTRYPEPGITKTRLIPVLGPEGSAAVQRQMTEHLLGNVNRLVRTRPLAVEIRFAGGDARLMENWLGSDFLYAAQGDGELDKRMTAALTAAFDAGAKVAVIIGTDIPGITAEIIGRAFDALRQKDAVFGPAADGGYYLVGLRKEVFGRALPTLFSGLPWGTNRVMALSLERAAELTLSVALLDTLEDVDRPEDLAVWERFAGPRISVVIPTLNEAANINETVRLAQNARNVEVVVVDGGSRDDTTEIAGRLGALVLAAEASRARQMNVGAAAATGDILLFLHADTRLPEGYDGQVRGALSQPGAAAGAFALGHRFAAALSAHHGVCGQLAVPLPAKAIWRSGALPCGGDFSDYRRVSRPADHGGFRTGPSIKEKRTHHHPAGLGHHIGPTVAPRRRLENLVCQPVGDHRLPLRHRSRHDSPILQPRKGN